MNHSLFLCLLLLLVLTLTAVGPVSARPVQDAPAATLLGDLRPILVSGADMDGICVADDGKRKWPFRIAFTEMDSATRSLKGLITWTENRCVTNIEGTFTDNTLSFTETSFVSEKPGSVLGTRYELTDYQEGTFTGTWNWQTDKGTVSFIVSPPQTCDDVADDEENVTECGLPEGYQPDQTSPTLGSQFFLLHTPYYGEGFDAEHNFTAFVTLSFTSWSPDNHFTGQMQYPQIDSIVSIEGQYEPGKLVMWEKSYLRKGPLAGAIGANFELKDDGSTGKYTGTYIQAGQGAGTLWFNFLANQPCPDTHRMPSEGGATAMYQLVLNRKYIGECNFSRTGQTYPFEIWLTWHNAKSRIFSGRMHWLDNDRTIKIKGKYPDNRLVFWEEIKKRKSGIEAATYTLDYQGDQYRGTWIQKNVGSGTIWFKLR